MFLTLILDGLEAGEIENEVLIRHRRRASDEFESYIRAFSWR